MVLFNFIWLPLQPHHNKTITQILQMDMEYQRVSTTKYLAK